MPVERSLCSWQLGDICVCLCVFAFYVVSFMCIDQQECLFWRRTMFQEYFESECLMVILYGMLGNGG